MARWHFEPMRRHYRRLTHTHYTLHLVLLTCVFSDGQWTRGRLAAWLEINSFLNQRSKNKTEQIWPALKWSQVFATVYIQKQRETDWGMKGRCIQKELTVKMRAFKEWRDTGLMLREREGSNINKKVPYKFCLCNFVLIFIETLDTKAHSAAHFNV